ncbi:glycogen debranching N-terminal domain-containing protein [Haloechinothrix halophila]|uniref:glycogen debranching N-terminal domain-containing protein n=1 Tax=Haloechinothrix halophila TaxID=1069073 RepID=UPI0005587B62|nr:glycogen debranching N-terminal domain-containing protein [Haloechinothrix halophila]
MSTGRQPLLHDAVIALHAPTQAWSRSDGAMTSAIDGLFHGDRRFLRGLWIDVNGERPEEIAVDESTARTAVFGAILRGIDDAAPDPHIDLARTRTVAEGQMRETIVIRSALATAAEATLQLVVEPDFEPLQEVKAGIGEPRPWRTTVVGDRVTVTSGDASFELAADRGQWRIEPDRLCLEWRFRVEPGTQVVLTWSATMHDPSLVVCSPSMPSDWELPTDGVDPRLALWVRTALDDLHALRLALPDHPKDAFLAAGPPWFFTLFGRDSIWAARMMLPVDVSIAASTLRVLARLQGTRDDAVTEEQPGKIAHELRASAFEMPGEGISLPSLYYGTVDATALWVCLLREAWRAGMPREEVAELIPNLRAALDWLAASAGADGFISYFDRNGNGLSNQGWKDSGDSIQWRDGRLAAGPIALSEVQGYAHEAATGAAELLDAFGEKGAERWRSWAADLRARFNERFWVTTDEGTYPAIALDRDGRAVDALASNIGHLLGTGILDADAESRIARLLTGPAMYSGYGVRTLSTESGGYWQLGYHVGAVWAHDSAIIAHGMTRTGNHKEAAIIVDGLLNAAEGFRYRMPELHSGHDCSEWSQPVPYPAACRPQAWSAAAAVTCLGLVGTLVGPSACV